MVQRIARRKGIDRIMMSIAGMISISWCYVTVGMFAQRGLGSTAKTLRSLSGVRGSEY